MGKDFLEENNAMINFKTKKLQLVIPSNSCHTNYSTTDQVQITTPSEI